MDIKYPSYRWYVAVVMFISTVAQGMVLISPTPLVGPIHEALGISLGQTTGLLMVTFTLFVAISGIAGGAIVDKVGLPRTYIMSISCMVLGSIIFMVAGTTIPLLILARIIQGIGAGPVISTVAKLAADWFPVGQRALVAGLSGGALSLGIAAGLQGGPQIFEATGNWNAAVGAMGTLSVIALILAIIFAKGPKPPVQEQTLLDDTAIAQGTSLFKLAVKQPAFFAGIITSFSISWVQQAYNDLTPGNIAVDPPVGLGFGPVSAGQIMGTYSLAFMVGSLVSGIILHAVFKDRARIFVPVCFIFTAIFCGSVLLGGVGGNQSILLVCLILGGFFMGMPMASTQAFISMSYPEAIQGKVGGTAMGLGIIGGTVGVAIGSVALHATGMYKVSIIIVVVLAIVGAIAGSFLKKPQIFQEKKQEQNLES